MTLVFSIILAFDKPCLVGTASLLKQRISYRNVTAWYSTIYFFQGHWWLQRLSNNSNHISVMVINPWYFQGNRIFSNTFGKNIPSIAAQIFAAKTKILAALSVSPVNCLKSSSQLNWTEWNEVKYGTALGFYNKLQHSFPHGKKKLQVNFNNQIH